MLDDYSMYPRIYKQEVCSFEIEVRLIHENMPNREW